MLVKIKRADFERGCHNLGQVPEPVFPEVAVIGRSNVGKSTLINRITQRRGLARTSSTPGRTQELNYFSVKVALDDRPDHELFLVDLPGFGYAKFSKARREQLSRLTVDYIDRREALQVVCLLNDCRRPPEEEELALRDVAFRAGRSVLVVVTKADKLGKNELKKQMALIADAYQLEPEDFIISGEKRDIAPFWERTLGLIEPLNAE